MCFSDFMLLLPDNVLDDTIETFNYTLSYLDDLPTYPKFEQMASHKYHTASVK